MPRIKTRSFSFKRGSFYQGAIQLLQEAAEKALFLCKEGALVGEIDKAARNIYKVRVMKKSFLIP